MVLLEVVAALWLAPVLLAGEPGEITTALLLDDMTNLANLPEFPVPAYTCKQFSSYDRASKSPTEDWFANGDWGHYLCIEDHHGREEHVMMDAEGPGAIVRIWSANPAGTVRIYIDGEAQPVLQASLADLLGGKYPGLPRPIAGEYSKGWNLYLPIPYARSCKVTSDKGGCYYHVNYRTYPVGTKVVSFKNEQISALDAELKALSAKLDAPGEHQVSSAGAVTKVFDSPVASGGSTVICKFKGPSSVRRFSLQWPPSGDRDESALRAVVLLMTFDGETTVAAPLGDFFGAAPGINPYESLPLSVAKDGRMDCRWVMPFENSAEIRVLNHGKDPVTLKGEIVTAPYAWTDASMLFHAKWRMQNDVSTEMKSDWNYMTATGKGVFAGVSFTIDNPVKDWWGEGDEKIYVDGETFPSHFGTGTEDYYGYAWCSSALFTHAYHNQPRCDGPGNAGRTSLNRFHIIDRIPFAKAFRFDMELWHWKKCQVNMSVINYWYAVPGAKNGFQSIQATDLVLRPIPELKVVRVKGAIEGEEMKIIEKTGQLETQEWFDASGEKHLWWRGGQKPGDTLVLMFEIQQAGPQRIFGRFLKAPDYGIAQFAINGQKAGEPIDFYNDEVIITPEIKLGTFDLKAGENKFAVTITGANEKSEKAYMVGIDYLLLKVAK